MIFFLIKIIKEDRERERERERERRKRLRIMKDNILKELIIMNIRHTRKDHE